MLMQSLMSLTVVVIVVNGGVTGGGGGSGVGGGGGGKEGKTSWVEIRVEEGEVGIRGIVRLAKS